MSLKTKELLEYSKEEILLIIKTYITEQIELSDRKLIDEDSFSKAGWSEYTAFQLGSKKALKKILDFLPSDKEDLT